MTVDLAAKIRDVPDFPKPGIVFKDIMPLLADADALRSTIDLLEALVPKLRSRNPEARQGALEDLHVLAELAQELSQLLFWRALRHRVS